MFILKFGSKQKNKINARHTMAFSYYSKVPLKIQQSHFSLVKVMKFSIVSPCLCKGKVFQLTLIPSWHTKLTFNVCMKTVNELYIFLTGFILPLRTFFCCSTILHLQIRWISDIRFSMRKGFLSCLPRIRVRWFLLIWLRKSYPPFKLFTS